MPRYFIARRAKAWIADEDTWEVPLATVIPTVSDHKFVSKDYAAKHPDTTIRERGE